MPAYVIKAEHIRKVLVKNEVVCFMLLAFNVPEVGAIPLWGLGVVEPKAKAINTGRKLKGILRE